MVIRELFAEVISPVDEIKAKSLTPPNGLEPKFLNVAQGCIPRDSDARKILAGALDVSALRVNSKLPPGERTGAAFSSWPINVRVVERKLVVAIKLLGSNEATLVTFNSEAPSSMKKVLPNVWATFPSGVPRSSRVPPATRKLVKLVWEKFVGEKVPGLGLVSMACNSSRPCSTRKDSRPAFPLKTSVPGPCFSKRSEPTRVPVNVAIVFSWPIFRIADSAN